MDTVIVKDGAEYIAVSLLPVGVFGWGSNQKDAVISLEENLYAYCNWLLKPLPKNTEVKVISKYSGSLSQIKFKDDSLANVKKYSEIVLQTAFSFKSMIESFETNENERSKVEELLNFFSAWGNGIIEIGAKICESEDLALMRGFIFKTYQTAQTLFMLSKERNVDIFDTFSFKFSY